MSVWITLFKNERIICVVIMMHGSHLQYTDLLLNPSTNPHALSPSWSLTVPPSASATSSAASQTIIVNQIESSHGGVSHVFFSYPGSRPQDKVNPSFAGFWNKTSGNLCGLKVDFRSDPKTGRINCLSLPDCSSLATELAKVKACCGTWIDSWPSS